MKKWLIRVFLIVGFINPLALYLGYKLKCSQEQISRLKAPLWECVECKDREVLTKEVLETMDDALRLCRHENNQLNRALIVLKTYCGVE